jgi:ribA/ribD-fused uncharacterized protein
MNRKIYGMSETIDTQEKYWTVDDAILFGNSIEEYRAFSNFAREFEFEWMGEGVESSENLYQALKFSDNRTLFDEVLMSSTPGRAKRLANSLVDSVIPDWTVLKIEAMQVSLAHKFRAHSAELLELLENTGKRSIIEVSKYDLFWGVTSSIGDFYGANVLGQLLVQIRDSPETIEAFLMKSAKWETRILASHS